MNYAPIELLLLWVLLIQVSFMRYLYDNVLTTAIKNSFSLSDTATTASYFFSSVKILAPKYAAMDLDLHFFFQIIKEVFHVSLSRLKSIFVCKVLYYHFS